jgi:hypothetical protein
VDRFLPPIEQLRESLAYWQEHGDLEAATTGGFLRLYAERERIINALQQLPQTLCHGDAHQDNLLWRYGAQGQEEMVAVDWAFVGTGAVGKEIARLISVAIFGSTIDAGDLPALDSIVFKNYLQGLEDAGWSHDPRITRLGYIASMVIVEGLCLMGLLVVRMCDKEWWQPFYEEFFGLPVDKIMAHIFTIIRYHLVLTEEARAILDSFPFRQSH